ncbi:glycoside hydrolase family 36 protein [uncultured Draconibacterium sp.]|uniref:alpha-galactosidase n=1 Tax=uncultured Draconibacterium sp. TaxID=1573823 RepID=UPI0029C0437C|nr:glycoside hydrolase family 36 protein [uncultured Draconibacterium sp.]
MNTKNSILLLILFLCTTQLFAQENKFKLGDNKLEVLFEINSNNQLKQRLILPTDYNGNTELPSTIAESDLEVSLHCTGENRASHHGVKLCGGMPGLRLQFDKKEEMEMPWGTRYIIYQKDAALQLDVISYYDFYKGTNTCRRYTKVRNNSKESVGINHLSSAMINNIGNLGQGSIDDKLLIHWAHNSWKAEGQWHNQKPSESGWGANGIFQLSGIFHNNLGSWSTIKELPMAMVENTAVGLTWFWQIEHNGSWHWEFSNVRASGEQRQTESTPTYIYLGGPDEEHHQAWKSLEPGEEYQTVPVAIGCVTGGFDEGVAALTKYRRAACLSPHPDNVECPVIFNDYMNCLFGDPTTEKELPLIDAAAKAGCDYYVIDAGWYAEQNEKWWDAVGLWQPGESRFPGGIEKLLSNIRDNEMTPGLWLEIERAGINSPLKTKPDDWFLMRHGKRVIDNDSYMLDFRNPKVINHANEVVNRVVDTYGAGYIKMDYNVNSLMGTETDASSMGQGLLEHQRAYLDWMKGVYKKNENLVIENCGSGGCRMDYAMLSQHQIQSSSDQTDYKKYPSIIVGTMAAVLPEQLAVWSYPMRDGDKYEASFNMVNAMMGRIHQSGHLAELPEESFAQVQNGIKIYKEEMAPLIPQSTPFFPLGMPSIEDKITPVAVGLENQEYDYYAVWRLSGNDVVQINQKNNGKAEILYPVDLGIKIKNGTGVFTVAFPEKYMAAIIKVRK